MLINSLHNTLFENIQNANGVFSKHFHDTYTIGITHSGLFKSMRLGQTALSYQNSTRVINPGEVHFGDSKTWKYTNIYPSADFMAEVYHQIFYERKLPLFDEHIIEDIALYKLFYNFFYSVFTKEDEMLIETNLIEAFSYLILHHSTKSEKFEIFFQKEKVISDSLEYIKSNLEHNIMLDDLAQTFEISKFHFLRVFKKTLGITPHNYILAQRVNKAKDEVLQGNSLNAAALNAGFNDQSHFARNFKKIYGYAPGILLDKSNFILYM